MDTKPQYDIDTIKYTVDDGIWQRAVSLYERGEVRGFKKMIRGYSAYIIGTSLYHVNVSDKHVDRGNCDCYMGERGQLCKHMVALAIYAVCEGRPLSDKEKQYVSEATFSGCVEDISEEALIQAKKDITIALRYIHGYGGSSREWFAYQSSLSQECSRLAKTLSSLPAHLKTAKLLVDTLLRIDKKMCTGGVDDSDGIVGDCMMNIVDVLTLFIEASPKCVGSLKKLIGIQSSFGWEEPLVKLAREHAEATEHGEKISPRRNIKKAVY